MRAALLRAAPFLFGALALLVWEGAVRAFHVPPYLFPGPVAIFNAFVADAAGLLGSLLSTLLVTFVALAAAACLGLAMALAVALSPLARAVIQPWAVVLQVTPIVAIAPLIIVLVGDPFAALVLCATIVAFFPVFANTASGLAAAAPELRDLFRLYGAGRWRTPAASWASTPGTPTATGERSPASRRRSPSCSASPRRCSSSAG